MKFSDEELNDLMEALRDAEELIELGEDNRTLEQLLVCLDDDQRKLIIALKEVLTESRDMRPDLIHNAVRIFYLMEEEALSRWYKHTIKAARERMEDDDDDEEPEEDKSKIN